MTESRAFHLGDILSVLSGVICTPNGMDGIHGLVTFMIGDGSREIRRFLANRAACVTEILAQHPHLDAVLVPDFDDTPSWQAAEVVANWLATQASVYGEHLDIRSLTATPTRER